MRNNRILRGITALIAAALICGVMAAPMTAYAYTDKDAESEIATPTPAPEPTPEPTPKPDPKPLTPDGNLTLVDDISGEQAHDKQFITVVTKSGNYFYLVIDRAGDKENVHFLNLVDEADLMAIIEGDKKNSITPAPVTPTPEQPTPAPEPAPEPSKSNNMGGLLIVLLLFGTLGGGAFYYFKVIKPKQALKGTSATELDEFEFDEDEEDLTADGNGAEYGSDEDMPDFTAAPDSEPEGFSYGLSDLSAGTTDSEDKQ